MPNPNTNYLSELINKHNIYYGGSLPISKHQCFINQLSGYDTISFSLEGVLLSSSGVYHPHDSRYADRYTEDCLPQALNLPETKDAQYLFSVATTYLHGITLHFKASDLVFKEGAPEGFEGSALEFFFEKSGILKIFEEFDPEKIVSKILVGKIYQEQKKSAKNIDFEIEQSRKTIEASIKRLDSEHKKIATLRQTRSTLEEISNVEEMVNDYSSILSNLIAGTMKIEAKPSGDNALVVRTKAFKVPVQGTEDTVQLGPYDVWCHLKDLKIEIKFNDETNLSYSGYWHPQISRHGAICWGYQGAKKYSEIKVKRNPLELLFYTLEWIQTSYNPGDAYHKLHTWNTPPGWYCNVCNEEHPHDTRCPQWRRCDRHNHEWYVTQTQVHRETNQGGEHCPLCVEEAMASMAIFFERIRDQQQQEQRKLRAASVSVAQFIRSLGVEQETQQVIDSGTLDALNSLQRFLHPLEEEYSPLVESEIEMGEYGRLPLHLRRVEISE